MIYIYASDNKDSYTKLLNKKFKAQNVVTITTKTNDLSLTSRLQSKDFSSHKFLDTTKN